MSVAEEMNRVERRRSERSPLGLPLSVRGVSLDTKPFQEETVTFSVSAYGALVALATTVTLGQALFLKNLQTQDEAEAWVTRLGLPHGPWTQVGIEFVRPDEDFWGTERRTVPGENAVAESASWDSGKEAPQAETTAPHSDAASGPTLPDILLHALEQTLQQAAEKVVAAATTSRLATTVNQAAESIENFSRGKVRQIEQRLEQYRQELVTSSREEVLSQIKADVAQTQEQLLNRAAELLEEAAREVHSDVAERLRETANQTAAQFGEEATRASAQHVANLAEQAQISINEARSQIGLATAALAESQEKVKAEMDQAVTQAQQKVESLASQSKAICAELETRLQAFREELAHSAEHEIGQFRERLQNVFTTLLSPLR
jgi:hypothetical protein